jgi:hypothetical protein
LEVVESLFVFPERGTYRKELLALGIRDFRQTAFKPYRVIYRVIAQKSASFDAILKRVKAKYVLGLTATPIPRDGQQPIIFMQCGLIRHTAVKPASAPHDLKVAPHSLHKRLELSQDAGIQDTFRHIASDLERAAASAVHADTHGGPFRLKFPKTSGENYTPPVSQGHTLTGPLSRALNNARAVSLHSA